MDWLEEMEEERQLLRRVVAAFYLFACIAGLSCAMPQRIRAYMLGRLRRLETISIGIVIMRARERGLTIQLPTHRIPDARTSADSRAEAMRFARIFRALAVLLRQINRHYPKRRTSGIDGNASPFAIAYHRIGSLLATLCRPLADMTHRQLHQAQMRLAVEPIDSS